MTGPGARRAGGDVLSPGIAFDAGTRIVEYAGRLAVLDPAPARVFAALTERVGRLVEREELLGALYGDRERPRTALNALNVHLCRIRGILLAIKAPIELHTLRRRGYRIVAMWPAPRATSAGDMAVRGR